MDFGLVFIAYIVDGVIFGFFASYLAKSKGYDDGFFWGFFLGAVGLIVIACRRDQVSDKPNSWICSKCGTANEPYSSYCIECGSIRTLGWRCSACNSVNYSNAKFCSKCGSTKGDSKEVLKSDLSGPEDFCDPTNPVVKSYEEQFAHFTDDFLNDIVNDNKRPKEARQAAQNILKKKTYS